MYIQLQDVSKNFSGFTVLDSIQLQINPGDKLGLIGNNGSGKTTLLKLITGEEAPTTGIVSRQKNLRIAYVQQQSEDNCVPLIEYLRDSFQDIQHVRCQMTAVEQQMTALDADFDRLMQRYGQLQEAYEHLDGYTLDDRIQTVLKGLGLAMYQETPFSQLSGGQKLLAKMAKVLLADADLYLLDEPTNHLDQTALSWLESFLKHSSAALLIISHDRYFLDQVVSKIVELDMGELTVYPGNYSVYQQLKQQQQAQLVKDYHLQQKEIQRLKLAIRRYRQWGNESDNEKFFKRANHLEKRLEKMQLIQKPSQTKGKLTAIKQAPRSGKEVVKAVDVAKSMGQQLLFQESSFMLYWQERVALIGANGSGKSTFLRLLLGTETSDSGTVKLGSNVTIGYLSQEPRFPKPEERLLTAFRSFVSEEQQARYVLSKFGFYAADVNKRLKDLSGGEAVRYHLACLLQQEINLLILDEPTNHLDIETREEVEKLLTDYHGTLLVVSHDRYFLQTYFHDFLVIQQQQIQKLTNTELPVLDD